MIIANPIYDTVFKFLLEDLEVAKQLLSAIIGEEIVELETRPQEQTAPSNRFLLTVFRVDFKAIVKTAAGETKKILIELQKSSHPYDIPRFRHYLGTNYSEPDVVKGEKTALPLLPIYFLGFNLTIKRPVLKIGRRYEDVRTGEFLDQKDSFIEHLSHDCFVVQIPALPPETRTKLEKLLSVFNQKFVFDSSQKWLLRFPGEIDDTELRPILKRLSLAAESPDMKEQIRVEEEFDWSMETSLREKERIIEQKEAIISEKDAAISEKDATLNQSRIEIEDLQRRLSELQKPPEK